MATPMTFAEWREVDGLMERIADASGNTCVLGRRSSASSTTWFAHVYNDSGSIECDGGSPLEAVRSVHARLVERYRQQGAASRVAAEDADRTLEVLCGI